jgi:hypothetical protein
MHLNYCHFFVMDHHVIMTQACSPSHTLSGAKPHEVSSWLSNNRLSEMHTVMIWPPTNILSCSNEPNQLLMHTPLPWQVASWHRADFITFQQGRSTKKGEVSSPWSEPRKSFKSRLASDIMCGRGSRWRKQNTTLREGPRCRVMCDCWSKKGTNPR